MSDLSAERSELANVLASGIFSRAPGLAQLLTYICARYFEGQAEQIKEYNIAVEAFGRPADFDQKKDSIVRVEAHRLRKRLKQFYENEGASHALQIEIPPGQYIPRFVPRDDPGRAVPAEIASAPVAPTPRRALGSNLGWIAAGSAAALVILAATLFFTRGSGASSAPRSPRESAAPPTDSVRILAGSAAGAYTDRLGRLWLADRFYTGGVARSDPNHAILGTREPKIYECRRQGTFRYDIPLTPGTYELSLHFAETYYGERNLAGGGETSRIFRVLANGRPLLSDFDVVSDAGPSRADIRVFKDVAPASDGKLHLEFVPQVNDPFVNAIEIAPSVPGHMRPIRIVCQDRQYADRAGRIWEADRYFSGGQLIPRSEAVLEATDPDLYAGERFGNLLYTIPVPAGRYDLTLHFSERWFGPGKPERGGAGSRLFDILCNGAALARNFDVFREAGGSDRALVKIFRGLQPNPQGKLSIALVPSVNYACVNAIEVVDSAP